MISGLTSINVVIAKIIRDLNFSGKEIPKNSLIEWLAEASLFIGSFNQFYNKTAEIDIEDYKGILPCDHYKTIQLIDGTCFDYSSGYLIGDTEEEIVAAQFTNKDFRVEFNQITTAYRTGKIKILYQAIPVDDCGLPLIPDDVAFREALFWFVSWKLAFRGDISQDWRICKNEWHSYCKKARASINMPDLAQMERLKNIWLSLVIDENQYSKMFSTLGKTGYIE
jgi:hypothetical protein